MSSYNNTTVYIHQIVVHNKNYPYAVLIALHIYTEITLHTARRGYLIGAIIAVVFSRKKRSEPAGFFPGHRKNVVTCLLRWQLQDGSEASPATSFP